MGWGTPRRSKYNAQRTEYPAGSGQWYDSKGEAAHAQRLDLLKAAGKIHDWRRGSPWVLLEEPNSIILEPDFLVWDIDHPERFRAVDFKGMLTDVFRLKAKLFKARYPDVPLWVAFADGHEEQM